MMEDAGEGQGRRKEEEDLRTRGTGESRGPDFNTENWHKMQSRHGSDTVTVTHHVGGSDGW